MKSKKISKSNRNSRICTTCLAILNCVRADTNYSAQIARALEKSPQTVHYDMHVLEKWGYIRRATGNKRSYPVFYELTDKGELLISNGERLARSGGFRFHHFALKYRVVVDNPDFLPVSKGVLLRGGVIEVTGRVEDYTVRRWHAPSDDYLYLFSRPMWGRLPWQLLSFASIELDRLSRSIEERFHMKLGFDGVLQKPELSDPRVPLAKFWGDYYGTVVKTNSGSGIDGSEGPWEAEFSYEDAVNHVQQGRNTAKVAKELPQVRALLEKLLGTAHSTLASAREQTGRLATLDRPDVRLYM
jgi:DNA-binding MarR family transcriptional regulator